MHSPRLTLTLTLTLLAACPAPGDSAAAIEGSTTGEAGDAPAPTTAPTSDTPTSDTPTSDTSTTGAPQPDGTTTASTGPGGEASTAVETSGVGPGPGCGDGILDPETEACDDGHGSNSNEAACTLMCALNVCGDGLVHAGVESCDEGQNNNDMTYGGCGTDCKPSMSCGDHQVQGPEECDLGPNNGSGNVELGGVGCDATCRYDAKLCFLTSEVYKAHTLGSAEQADELCRTRAFAAGYDNAEGFMAWVSDDQSSPATRFTPTNKPYVMPNGIRVAHSTQHLLVWGPITGIIHTDKGEDLPDVRVWTATANDATLYDPALDCDDWNSISFQDQARVGRSSVDEQDLDAFNAWRNGYHWTDFTTLGCHKEYRLYCFEQ